jgi:hypothetical protein
MYEEIQNLKVQLRTELAGIVNTAKIERIDHLLDLAFDRGYDEGSAELMVVPENL